jgi:hypothetical protein
MIRTFAFWLAMASPFAMSLAFIDAAAAQKAKKLSYEQAWAQCKQEVSKNLPGENVTSAGRYAAGGACMTKYGYRLKKKSSF